MKLVRSCAAVWLFLVLNTVGYAAENSLEDSLEVRPDVGYGYAEARNHDRGMGYNAGVRILSEVRRNVPDPASRKWAGVTIEEVSPFESNAALRNIKYLAVGIILEKTIAADFVVTIGTLGYIGHDQAKNDPFGVLAEVGWQPRLGKDLQGFLALRTEAIYDTSTISRYAVSAGVKYTLF